MPLFQHSVINKYLAGLSKPELDEAYSRFIGFFLDPKRQQNIRNAKEEQYQEGFLRELFVQVLGYTLNPDPGFNLTTEHRNVKDSRKADGAILSGDTVKAVIEMKGTEVTDLARVESQAFGYKNNQPGCRYVIISNFEKIRFYIDNAVDHLEFNLFTLTRQEFDLLWLCLSHACLMQDLPTRIREESVSRETEITRALYRDYSLFKRELHQNLTELNPQFDPLTLFKKSQKLLSRLLFLFFAEDRNLLPPNSVRLVLGDWRDLKERDVEVPLYDRFKKYFGYLNTGFKGKRYDVFAYNGGLFKPDPMLDAVRIDDELLYRHTLKLSEYDFISEIDVNILGHIFENSLNELDEIRAQLEGTPVDKSKTKRKKEGVYYTPKYITKYIVENTVGRLCREKREELAIVDEEYTDAVRRQTKTRQALLDKLTAYRTWLLHLTICDPACGSGAFLNQALEFLIAEHHAVDELQSRLFGDAMVLSDLDKSILENNLYGVDLNEESVEIARLSLWLRTARPNRTLNDLSANIKVGNSLVDDPAVAGDKAFDWHKEFPHVFAKGGFDVVIGNPPYVRADSPGNKPEFRNYLMNSSHYETLGGKWDLYIPFIEQSIKISNEHGRIALIVPDAYCHAEYSVNSRNWVKENHYLNMIDYYPEIMVFENVGVKSVIVNFGKTKFSSFSQRIHQQIDCYSELLFTDYPVSFRNDYKEKLINFQFDQVYTLQSICYSSKGIVGNSDEKHYQGEFELHELVSESKDDIHTKLYYEGKDINRWMLSAERWIEYGTDRSPSKWSRKGFPEMFEGAAKLVTMRSPGLVPRTFLDKFSGYFNESAIGFKRWIDLKGVTNSSLEKAYKDESERQEFETISASYTLTMLLSIMNSSLIRYELNSDRRSNIHIYPEDWKKIPVPRFSEQTKSIFASLDKTATEMILLNQDLHSLTSSFHRTLHRHFGLEVIPAKLQRWCQMSYGEFVKELQKKKVKLTLAQEAEWEPYFLSEAAKAQELKRTVDATDREIDRMVYELYGLTEEEIAIVEGRESNL